MHICNYFSPFGVYSSLTLELIGSGHSGTWIPVPMMIGTPELNALKCSPAFRDLYNPV